MIKKNNRLKKKKEFNFIYKKGQVIHSKSFLIHFTRALNPFVQIGISVSKQVGNSVVRSRVKRIISEACRLNIEKFAIKNYVITAKIECATKTSVEIEKELLEKGVLEEIETHIEEEKRLDEEMIEEEAKTWEQMRKEIPFIK